MKIKYKYIEFSPFAETIWYIENHKSGESLGILEYNKKWKEWGLSPDNDTGWTAQCLLDVIDFINQLKKEQQ